MSSVRTVLALLLGVALLLHPVLGDGPGRDTQYTYEPTPIGVDNDEAVEVLYELPDVAYGDAEQVRAVRKGANETVVRPESAVDDDLRSLTDVEYLADDAGDQYYAVDAQVSEGQYRLDARPVSPRDIATELAVEPDTADPIIRQALDGESTADRRLNATLVAEQGRYILVRVVDTTSVPDPLAIPKVLGYGFGAAAVIFLLVTDRD